MKNGYELVSNMLNEMTVTIGEKGLKNSWQQEFQPTTKCVHCGGTARIACVGYEGPKEDKEPIASLHKNEPKGEGYWVHDKCAIATYLCKKCLEPTSLYNQA